MSLSVIAEWVFDPRRLKGMYGNPSVLGAWIGVGLSWIIVWQGIAIIDALFGMISGGNSIHGQHLPEAALLSGLIWAAGGMFSGLIGVKKNRAPTGSVERSTLKKWQIAAYTVGTAVAASFALIAGSWFWMGTMALWSLLAVSVGHDDAVWDQNEPSGDPQRSRSGELSVPKQRSSVRGRSRKAWIFQCPEETYLNWITETGNEGGGFRVTRYKNKIQTGDRVFIWTSGKRAGVRAIAETAGEVGAFQPSSVMFHENFEAMKDHPWVELTPLRLMDEPYPRVEAKSDPVLSDMMIIRAAMGSIFALTDEEAARLEAIVSHRMGPSARNRLDAQPNLLPPIEDGGGAPVTSSASSSSHGNDVESLVTDVRDELANLAGGAHELSFPFYFGEDTFAFQFAEFGSFYITDIGEGKLEWGVQLSSALDESTYSDSELLRRLDEVWRTLQSRKDALHWQPGPGARRFRHDNQRGLRSWARGPRPNVSVIQDREMGQRPLAEQIAEGFAAMTPVATIGRLEGPIYILPMKIDVFISYAREDYKFVNEMITEFSAVAIGRVNFHWDENLSAETPWTKAIEKWIKSCDAAFVVLSCKSVDPERWVWSREVAKLLERREADYIPIIGVAIEELNDEQMQWVEQANIQMVDAERDSGRRNQPVYRREARKWNVALLRDLEEGLNKRTRYTNPPMDVA